MTSAEGLLSRGQIILHSEPPQNPAWLNPDETVLPPQHPQWLGDRIPDATLMTTSTLGHRASNEDPDPDRRHMYGWLTG